MRDVKGSLGCQWLDTETMQEIFWKRLSAQKCGKSRPGEKMTIQSDCGKCLCNGKKKPSERFFGKTGFLTPKDARRPGFGQGFERKDVLPLTRPLVGNGTGGGSDGFYKSPLQIQPQAYFAEALKGHGL